MFHASPMAVGKNRDTVSIQRIPGMSITSKPPAKLRAVLSRARLKAERAALAAAASDHPDPALRRQVAGLDRHIQLRGQRLDPSKNPGAANM